MIQMISLQVRRKGYWTLFVEFPGDRYSKSPRKIISRDSYSHWVRPYGYTLLSTSFALFQLCYSSFCVIFGTPCISLLRRMVSHKISFFINSLLSNFFNVQIAQSQQFILCVLMFLTWQISFIPGNFCYRLREFRKSAFFGGKKRRITSFFHTSTTNRIEIKPEINEGMSSILEENKSIQECIYA